ncbi:hypothetical protein L596_000249 [Steinernema carpocapsae]|uniref:Uncharacterized protein n=1 Tax=Steinernema carpocapsae TaxID=34508 RepID=A0A4U8UHE4_STECR|nr:hypothetical protein L596_000249 [Steinernema carpocapsae]
MTNFRMITTMTTTVSTCLREIGNYHEPLSSAERVDSVKKAIEQTIRQTLTEHQKLYFADINLGELRPEVVITQEPWPRLIIIGPKDIKSRSGGRLRVADRIIAVGTQLYLNDVNQQEKKQENEDQTVTVAGNDKFEEKAQRSGEKPSDVRPHADVEEEKEEQEEHEEERKKPCDAAVVEESQSSSSTPSSPASQPQQPRPPIFDNFPKTLDEAEASGKHLVLAVVRDTAQMVVSL